MTTRHTTTRAVALFLLAFMFVYSGVMEKLLGFTGTAAFIASKGLPYPMLLTLGALLVEIVVASALFWQVTRAPAALVLALYSLATALLFHDFWHGDTAAHSQLNEFLKNLGLVGGFLFVYADARERSEAETAAAWPRAQGTFDASAAR